MTTRALTGRPKDTLPALERAVVAIVGAAEVRKFYIGREAALDDRGGAFGRDATVVLYETASLRSAIEVADALVLRFLDHVKSWNHGAAVSERPSGRSRERVCLALWYRG